jgi:hypothetical protein
MTPIKLRIAAETVLAQLRMEAQRPAAMPIRQLRPGEGMDDLLRRIVNDRIRNPTSSR